MVPADNASSASKTGIIDAGYNISDSLQRIQRFNATERCEVLADSARAWRQS
jgi:hypothetical protein